MSSESNLLLSNNEGQQFHSEFVLSIRETLREATQTHGLPPFEARMLLEHILQQPHSWLITHQDECLTLLQAQAFSALCGSRAQGQPMAYLLGWREFYGRRFAVNPDVLIPRPETELLVEIALEKVRQMNLPHAQLIDLGTGSGILAITLALEASKANHKLRVLASDLSSAALTIAQKNATTLGAEVRLLRSNWWQNIPPQAFDFILSNPPYIHAADPHLTSGDLRFEPRHALTDLADGLNAYRAICIELLPRLRPSGWVLFEHGYDQAEAVQNLLQAQNLQNVQTWQDLAGNPRVSGGQRAAASY